MTIKQKKTSFFTNLDKALKKIADKVDEQDHLTEYHLSTPVGKLTFTLVPSDEALFSRWDEEYRESASARFSNVNSYSGKWHHYYYSCPIKVAIADAHRVINSLYN